MKPWRFVAILIVVCSTLPLAWARGSPPARGAEVFAANGCLHCHSIGGVGGHRGPDLSDVGKRRSKTAIREQIVRGSKVMPAYGDVLTRVQIDDLVRYLRSCRQKPGSARAVRQSSR